MATDYTPLQGGSAQPGLGPTCYKGLRCHSGQAISTLPSPKGQGRYIGPSSVAGTLSRAPDYFVRPAHHRSHSNDCPIPASPTEEDRDRSNPAVPPIMYSQRTRDALTMYSRTGIGRTVQKKRGPTASVPGLIIDDLAGGHSALIRGRIDFSATTSGSLLRGRLTETNYRRR